MRDPEQLREAMRHERDRRYFSWLAITYGVVCLYAWIVYPVFILSLR
jgi:hypothetical protein